jgi:mRNA-degrading endonuclease YafQ of YafQ-DinJ toxin-antitoxin module
VKSLFEAQQPWGVLRSNILEPTLKEHLPTFPDLREKLVKFLEVKLQNPLTMRYGKHDRPFTGPLVGYSHCHLRDDAILIYTLKNHSINLICIVTHNEIEGKRVKAVVKRLKQL